MLTNKIWVYNDVPEESVGRIAKEAGISELMARILINRGIEQGSKIKRFLNPSIEDMHDPFLLCDMDKATERVIQAIKNKEKITIYGDYDVDGVTSTSILYRFLTEQGAITDYYIPDRIEEGYGLSNGAIEKIKKTGTSLIVTVDCGITSIDEAEYIKNIGMEIIITDHHECIDVLPDAYAVINPCRHDCKYPFKSLAGVGVVYKLIAAICKKMNLGDIYNNYLDLVALGTVADVVPLIDENRIIVKYGISKMEHTSNIGLKTVLESSGLSEKPITTYSISFGIAPKINVAGRIGDAGRAVTLFTTEDRQEAARITGVLNQENKYRQDTEAEIVREVRERIEADQDIKNRKVLVVDGEGWHHGIIGIVASKITEKYYKPCILITRENGNGKGSARSIEGFNLFKALDNCKNLLDKYGGHELAAGLTMKAENIEALRKKINLYADNTLKDSDLIPKIKIDVILDKNQMNIDNVREIEKLAPYGAGNPGPVFSCSDWRINEIRTVGEDKHLKLKLGGGGLNIEAIGFNMGSLASNFDNTDVLDVACHLEINSWNSTDKVQLNLKDIKPSQETLMINNYYRSLDQSLRAVSWPKIKTVKDLKREGDVLKSDKELESLINDSVSNDYKFAILVNSIASARNLLKILRKSAAGIKKDFKICYTGCNSQLDCRIYAIINPVPEYIDFTYFQKVVLYGFWADESYLGYVAEKLNDSQVAYYLDKDSSDTTLEEIVPERKDLVVVYQYLKASLNAGNTLDNLFILSKRISGSYKMTFNYFKVKKCIEILEELGLFMVERDAGDGFKVKTVPDAKGKVNIENSLIYRNLQELKKGG
ncbi:MAG TPA: single-stranded-DNA-specific exonuclease RecJ [Clostridia bacterium]|nr:single-stranded-DNA-specific exonuclease RecJ [Clostridia bacterium]